MFKAPFATWLQQEADQQRIAKACLASVWSRESGINEQLESRYFLLPGSLAIIMTLIGTLLTALVVSREWERGTMEALISTPVKTWELIAGKVIPYFFLGMLSMAFACGVRSLSLMSLFEDLFCC